jgi:putative transposase
MSLAIAEMAPTLGIAQACRLLGVPRSQYYRALRPRRAKAPAARASAAEAAAAARPPEEALRGRRTDGALSTTDRDAIRALLTSQRFADQAPREIYATLLDQGIYLCCWPTM